MGTPEIIPRVFFALRPEIKRCAHYVSDFQILYPAGSVLILHNIYEKRQRYFNLNEKSVFLYLIAISPSRKLAAIILNGEKAQILVIDLKTLKKRRTLNLPPDSTTNRFEDIAFTHDDVYLLAITGEPDWNLVLYNWSKGKLTSCTKALNTSGPCNRLQVLCSPTDASEICIIGPGVFRLLSRNETVWRQYGFQKADLLNITTATWLTGSRIIFGTIDGKLIIIENGEVKAVFTAFTVNVINLQERDESMGASCSFLMTVQSDVMASEDLAVRALVTFPKGFAYSCRSGFVFLFEKEGPNRYKKRNVFRIFDADLTNLPHSELNLVQHLSVNASQDKLLAVTNRAQLYSVRLWGPDINVAPEIAFKPWGEPLHHGPIISLSTCVWKPVFISAGKLDRTIRLWNYETELIHFVKHYTEEILCVDLHPTGSFMAIGFHERLDVCFIIMNDIQPIRSFNEIKHCETCRFSCSGQYLAVVNGDVIEIMGTILLNNIFCLKGHIGKVSTIKWMVDDKKLASCSLGGDIIIWDIVNGTLLHSIRTPEVAYCDLCVTSDGKKIFAVDAEGYLKIFSTSEDRIQKPRKLFASIIQNIASCGSPIWTEEIKKKKKLKLQVIQLQRKMAQRICRSYKTTSAAAAMVLAGTPPLAIVSEARQYSKEQTGNSKNKEAKELTKIYIYREWEKELLMTVKVGNIFLEKIFMSRSNLVLFVSGKPSDILVVKMPVSEKPEFVTYQYHTSRITQLTLSHDDQNLITISDGGAIILWKVNFTEGMTAQIDKNVLYSTEVLINKNELQKKILTIKDLSAKLYELEMGQARETKDTELSYKEMIKDIHEKYNQNIEELKDKIEHTEADHDKQLEEIKKEVDDIKEKQMTEKENLVHNYTHKLTVECEKVQTLAALREQMINEFEEKVANLEKEKQEETDELIRVYEIQLAEVNNLLHQTYEENVKNIKDHEEIKQYIENDTNRELVEYRAKHEELLKEEIEQNSSLIDEAAIMKKNFAEAQKERDGFREKLEMLQATSQKFQSNIHLREKDVAELKAEIVERDAAAEEKDEKIFFLKKKIQELDKYKFVLDYKIKELNKEIDPKNREIREQKEQITDMEVELGNLKTVNSSLELQLTELKEKIHGTEKEIAAYEKKYLLAANTMKQIRVDIYSLYQDIGNFKKLRDGIRALYHKYHDCEITSKEQFGESDMQRELLIQRELLEKTIKALRSTLHKSLKFSKSDSTKVFQDNEVLLEELNAIRRDLKEAHTLAENLENLIGNKNNFTSPSAAYHKMQMALIKQQEVKQAYQGVINNAEGLTQELHDRAIKMQAKLYSLMDSEQQ